MRCLAGEVVFWVSSENLRGAPPDGDLPGELATAVLAASWSDLSRQSFGGLCLRRPPCGVEACERHPQVATLVVV